MAGRIVIIVDDGIATGSTAAAACQVVRAAGAARVVLAVPVAPPERIGWLRQFADEVVCLSTPEMFFAIGAFYANFDQTSDDEVISLLSQATARTDAAPAAAPIGVAGAGERGGPGGPGGPGERRGPGRDAEVGIPAGAVRLTGRLTMPDPTLGIVVFAHGSGSSRHSPRNRYVAADLNSAGLATLLFDLLTPEEEADRANVFDIPLLARRLVEVTRWLGAEPSTRHQPIGYFGASTGAAAALWAAAEPGVDIAAVVSRGGRADLATPRLTAVRAPTLLIVGEHDDLVTELNNQARALLRCENRLAIVPTATHLFTEPGTLEQVAALARDWFLRHLAMAAPRVSG